MIQKKKNLISIFIILMSVSFLINFVSASGSEWGYWRSPVTTYGSGINSIGLGAINSSASIINMTNGITLDPNNYVFWTEPILMSFREPNVFNNYLAIPNGNYIEIYDQSINLVGQIYTNGGTLGQMSKGFSTLSTTDPNSQQGLYAITRFNSTLVTFRGYSFNFTSLNFKEFASANYSFSNGNNISSTGLRCQQVNNQNHCYASLFAYNSSSTNYTIYMADFQPNNNLIVNELGESRNPVSSIPTFADWDNDGIIEGLIYTLSDVFVANTQTDTLDSKYSAGYATNNAPINIRYASFAQLDSSPYWKMVLAEDTGFSTGTDNYCKILALRNDYSTLWTNYLLRITGALNGRINRCSNFLISDYTGDGFVDIVAMSDVASEFLENVNLTVVKGNDGSTYRQFPFSFGGSKQLQGFPYDLQLTGGRLTNSTSNNYDVYFTYYNFNGGNQKQFGVAFSIQNNQTLYTTMQQDGNTSSVYGCIIGDLIYDGYNDIICSRRGSTYIIGQSTGTFPNNNSVIDSLSFNPSTTVSVSSTLSVTVNAHDTEGDSILYKVDCGNGFISGEDINPIKTCTYNAVGVYTLIAYVRDGFHVSPTQYSVPITVTYTSTSCNLNGICESGLGETSASCPSDCPVTQNQTLIVGGHNGTLSIPAQLVDTNNQQVGNEKGLLPEIYYGILGFLSNSLSPVFILVFIIFVVLIILAIATIIKNIFIKVGNLAH